MDYPKKGCDVGYFSAQEPIKTLITISRRSSVTKPCFLSIGLRSDRWPKVARSRPKRTCIFFKKSSLACARDKFCESTRFDACKSGARGPTEEKPKKREENQAHTWKSEALRPPSSWGGGTLGSQKKAPNRLQINGFANKKKTAKKKRGEREV